MCQILIEAGVGRNYYSFHEPRSSRRESAHYSPTGKVRADSRRAATVHGPDARQKAVEAFHEPGVERDRVCLLPLPARNERGEGRGGGNSYTGGLLSPRPPRERN